MKTLKIFLIIAGFALTSISFGQLLSRKSNDMLLYTAYYNSATNRFEHLLHPYTGMNMPGDRFEEPVITRTYFAGYENNISIEPWMTAPFESSVYEEEPMIESWMLSPFESDYFEPDPIIEEWMTTPFVLDDEIEIETWMTEPWL
jgi:hypothetical protein